MQTELTCLQFAYKVKVNNEYESFASKDTQPRY